MNVNNTKAVRNRLVKVLRVFAFLLLGFGLVHPALALDLRAAKAQGLVGETESGYLSAVKGGSQEVEALVDSTNTLRRKEYQRIAQQNGIALEKVEALAGKKAIDKTPAGQYIKLGGNWQKK